VQKIDITVNKWILVYIIYWCPIHYYGFYAFYWILQCKLLLWNGLSFYAGTALKQLPQRKIYVF